MTGYLLKKITGIVSSKICRQCSKVEVNVEEPPKNVSPRNYYGSSKSMETDVVLLLYIEIFETSSKVLHLKEIIVDDDSSMRALLKRQNNNSKGRLPEEMIDQSG